MIGEENEKIYGFFKIIAITITYIVIGFIIIFFVATSKVDALSMTLSEMPQDGLPYAIGTRSGGEITSRSVTYIESLDSVPPTQVASVPTSAQYWSIGLNYPARKDRVYMVVIYYSLGLNGQANYNFNELTGMCTGYGSACNNGTQTSNYTRLLFDSSTQIITIDDNSIYENSNGVLQISDSNPTLKAKKVTMILKANENGPYITAYLNGNNSGQLMIYGTEVLDMGESSDVLKIYIDTKTQSIIDWTTAKTNELALNISGVGDKVDDLKSNAQNWYNWTNNNINNKYNSTITSIDNAKSSINTTITNATNSTNQAIDNQTQDITDNQNENSQNEINNANNNAWQCSTQTQDLIDMPLGHSKKYLNSNGELVSSNGYDVTDYVKVQGTFKIIFNEDLSNDNQLSLCLYNENYQKTRCERYTPNVSGYPKQHQTIVQEGEVYAKFSFDRQASVYNEYYSGTYCVNRENNNSTIINNNINNINNNLTDSNVDDPTNSINGLNNQIGTNGVISDLLLLPVNIFQKLLNSVNGTCTTFNLGTLFGHQLTMPCINISSFLGQAIYNSIDIMISGFFILRIRKKFVDIFNNITSLKTGGNELE